VLLNAQDWREAAKRRLPRFVFDYIDGTADDGQCHQRNRSDLDALTLAPRVLVDTSQLDMRVQVLGQPWALPFGIAPTGLNGLIRPGGDGMLAGAAAKLGVPFALSTASNMRLEQVRQLAPGGTQWMQLYVMHRAIAERIVVRAQEAGYQALVLTVDVPVGGHRERDVRHGFKLPFNPSMKLAWDVCTHPAWALDLARSGTPEFVNLQSDADGPASPEVQAALLTRAMDRTLAWDSLRWLRELWKGPLLLKGVLRHEDARRAIDHGVDGLIVSNHGGRQMDAAPSAISVLPQVVSAVEGKIPVMMDGGIRRGSDMAKALALGASGVFIGRPALFALAVAGQAGVEQLLVQYRMDLERTLILLGVRNIDELRSLI